MLSMIPSVTKKHLVRLTFVVRRDSLQAAKKTADKSKTILNNIERWQKVCDLKFCYLALGSIISLYWGSMLILTFLLLFAGSCEQ